MHVNCKLLSLLLTIGSTLSYIAWFQYSDRHLIAEQQQHVQHEEGHVQRNDSLVVTNVTKHECLLAKRASNRRAIHEILNDFLFQYAALYQLEDKIHFFVMMAHLKRELSDMEQSMPAILTACGINYNHTTLVFRAVDFNQSIKTMTVNATDNIATFTVTINSSTIIESHIFEYCILNYLQKQVEVDLNHTATINLSLSAADNPLYIVIGHIHSQSTATDSVQPLIEFTSSSQKYFCYDEYPILTESICDIFDEPQLHSPAVPEPAKRIITDYLLMKEVSQNVLFERVFCANIKESIDFYPVFPDLDNGAQLVVNFSLNESNIETKFSLDWRYSHHLNQQTTLSEKETDIRDQNILDCFASAYLNFSAKVQRILHNDCNVINGSRVVSVLSEGSRRMLSEGPLSLAGSEARRYHLFNEYADLGRKNNPSLFKRVQQGLSSLWKRFKNFRTAKFTAGGTEISNIMNRPRRMSEGKLLSEALVGRNTAPSNIRDPLLSTTTTETNFETFRFGKPNENTFSLLQHNKGPPRPNDRLLHNNLNTCTELRRRLLSGCNSVEKKPRVTRPTVRAKPKFPRLNPRLAPFKARLTSMSRGVSTALKFGRGAVRIGKFLRLASATTGGALVVLDIVATVFSVIEFAMVMQEVHASRECLSDFLKPYLDFERFYYGPMLTYLHIEHAKTEGGKDAITGCWPPHLLYEGDTEHDLDPYQFPLLNDSYYMSNYPVESMCTALSQEEVIDNDKVGGRGNASKYLVCFNELYRTGHEFLRDGEPYVVWFKNETAAGEHRYKYVFEYPITHANSAGRRSWVYTSGFLRDWCSNSKAQKKRATTRPVPEPNCDEKINQYETCYKIFGPDKNKYYWPYRSLCMSTGSEGTVRSFRRDEPYAGENARGNYDTQVTKWKDQCVGNGKLFGKLFGGRPGLDFAYDTAMGADQSKTAPWNGRVYPQQKITFAHWNRKYPSKNCLDEPRVSPDVLQILSYAEPCDTCEPELLPWVSDQDLEENKLEERVVLFHGHKIEEVHSVGDASVWSQRIWPFRELLTIDGKCLSVEHIAHAYPETTTAVRTEQCNGGIHQQWHYDPVKSEIISQTGRCLTASTAQTQKVCITVCKGGKEQRWMVHRTQPLENRNSWTQEQQKRKYAWLTLIRTLNDLKCLNMKSMLMEDCSDGKKEQLLHMKSIQISTEYQPKKCWELEPTKSYTAGAAILLKNCSGFTQQHWHFDHLSNKIKSHSGFCLNQAAVLQFPCDEVKNEWLFQEGQIILKHDTSRCIKAATDKLTIANCLDCKEKCIWNIADYNPAQSTSEKKLNIDEIIIYGESKKVLAVEDLEWVSVSGRNSPVGYEFKFKVENGTSLSCWGPEFFDQRLHTLPTNRSWMYVHGYCHDWTEDKSGTNTTCFSVELTVSTKASLVLRDCKLYVEESHPKFVEINDVVKAVQLYSHNKAEQSFIVETEDLSIHCYGTLFIDGQLYLVHDNQPTENGFCFVAFVACDDITLGRLSGTLKMQNCQQMSLLLASNLISTSWIKFMGKELEIDELWLDSNEQAVAVYRNMSRVSASCQHSFSIQCAVNKNFWKWKFSWTDYEFIHEQDASLRGIKSGCDVVLYDPTLVPDHEHEAVVLHCFDLRLKLGNGSDTVYQLSMDRCTSKLVSEQWVLLKISDYPACEKSSRRAISDFKELNLLSVGGRCLGYTGLTTNLVQFQSCIGPADLLFVYDAVNGIVKSPAGKCLDWRSRYTITYQCSASKTTQDWQIVRPYYISNGKYQYGWLTLLSTKRPNHVATEECLDAQQLKLVPCIRTVTEHVKIKSQIWRTNSIQFKSQSNKCLHFVSLDPHPVLKECTGVTEQHWYFDQVTNLIVSSDGRCLNSNATLVPCSDAAPERHLQQWELQVDNTHKTQIRNSEANQCLATTAYGVNMKNCTECGSAECKWLWNDYNPLLADQNMKIDEVHIFEPGERATNSTASYLNIHCPNMAGSSQCELTLDVTNKHSMFTQQIKCWGVEFRQQKLYHGSGFSYCSRSTQSSRPEFDGLNVFYNLGKCQLVELSVTTKVVLILKNCFDRHRKDLNLLSVGNGESCLGYLDFRNPYPRPCDNPPDELFVYDALKQVVKSPEGRCLEWMRHGLQVGVSVCSPSTDTQGWHIVRPDSTNTDKYQYGWLSLLSSKHSSNHCLDNERKLVPCIQTVGKNMKSQIWRTNSIQLKSQSNSKCLAFEYLYKFPVLNSCTGVIQQHWYFDQVTNRIVTSNGRCLNSRITLDYCSDAKAEQQWELQVDNTHKTQIKNSETNQCLATTAYGVNMKNCTECGSGECQWLWNDYNPLLSDQNMKVEEIHTTVETADGKQLTFIGTVIKTQFYPNTQPMGLNNSVEFTFSLNVKLQEQIWKMMCVGVEFRDQQLFQNDAVGFCFRKFDGLNGYCTSVQLSVTTKVVLKLSQCLFVSGLKLSK